MASATVSLPSIHITSLVITSAALANLKSLNSFITILSPPFFQVCINLAHPTPVTLRVAYPTTQIIAGY
jgi:hypothetical protein